MFELYGYLHQRPFGYQAVKRANVLRFDEHIEAVYRGERPLCRKPSPPALMPMGADVLVDLIEFYVRQMPQVSAASMCWGEELGLCEPHQAWKNASITCCWAVPPDRYASTAEAYNAMKIELEQSELIGAIEVVSYVVPKPHGFVDRHGEVADVELAGERWTVHFRCAVVAR